jgi:hypothetical protein
MRTLMSARPCTGSDYAQLMQEMSHQPYWSLTQP